MAVEGEAVPGFPHQPSRNGLAQSGELLYVADVEESFGVHALVRTRAVLDAKRAGIEIHGDMFRVDKITMCHIILLTTGLLLLYNLAGWKGGAGWFALLNLWWASPFTVFFTMSLLLHDAAHHSL